MAVLVGLDGRRLARTLPPRASFGSPLTGPFPPLWSDGDTVDSMGDHGFSSSRLISYGNIYNSQTSVASCVNKLVRQIAVVPLRVYKVNGLDNRTPVKSPDNPLVNLLRHPAPRCGEMRLKQWMAFPALLHGNGLLAKFRDVSDGPPTALLPVKWQYTSAYAQQGGPVELWSTTQTGEERVFPVEESIHLAWEGPSGEVGTSPLQQLGTTVRLEDAAQRYSTSSFNNAVRPSLGITLPESQGKDQAQAIRETVQATHGGVDKAFLTLVVGGGAKFEQLSHSAAEAELTDQRRLNFEEVCRVYDTSPQLLGDARNASYNTMTEVKKMLYQVTLLPWLDFIKEVIETQLIEGEEEFDGHEVDFELRDLLRGTPSEELATMVNAVTNGVMAVNEARQVIGLAPLPDEQFDKPMIPTNNLQPISAAGAAGDNRADPNNPNGQRGGTSQAVENPPNRPSGT